MRDQMAVIDRFSTVARHATRTIAWGASMGGLVSAGLVQKYPSRFSGALTLCGLLGGSVGGFNEWLDQTFALNTLLASGQLRVVNILDVHKDIAVSAIALKKAQASPQGRARIELVAALGDLPGWNNIADPNPPQPGRLNYLARERYNYSTLQALSALVFFAVRQSFEAQAGGNFSWNVDVDYRTQLKRSVDYDDVKALYARAGLSIDADLDRLNNAPRIAADPAALAYAERYVTYNGEITVPVLVLQTTGDDVVVNQHAQAYSSVVRGARNSNLLRELFVHRSGHISFSAAEVIAGLEALVRRLDRGEWSRISPEDLNYAALQLGPKYNARQIPDGGNAPLGSGPSASPAFMRYDPAIFLRPFAFSGS
jgi:alpha-beta hydrolase superfamily lysophospholipase